MASKKKKSAAKKTAPKKQTSTQKKPVQKATKKAPAKKPAKKAAKKAAKKPAKKATKKAAKKKAVKVKGTRHEPSVFLLIHLPLTLSPMERFERFEEPIDDALGAVGDDGAVLGEVSGGGSSLDENGAVVSCDVEVEVHDVARALPILRRVLRENSAPPGTVVTRLAPDGAFEVLDQL